jgi:DNA-binding response OmpR family regulator
MASNVLIVDCDEYTTQKIDAYLKVLGFTTALTRNGQIGLATLRTQRPDLILLASDLKDMDPALFMERKNRMLEVEKTPVILLARDEKAARVKPQPKKGPIEAVGKPVMLGALKKKMLKLLNLQEQAGEKHLTAEVFIRDGIVVVELRGALVEHELVSLKYWILDTARSNQTLNKRFFIIIYELDGETLTQPLFDRLFQFVQFFPDLPKSNVKILTSDEGIRSSIAASKAAAGFEIVSNYIVGLDKLKALYLAQGDEEILVEFLVPNAALYKNVYDQHGRLVKGEGKSFNQEELQGLLKRGIRKLYYMRKAQVGHDSQIVENEDVDVVMDAIQVNGAVIPEGLKGLFQEQEAKKRFTVGVLIVNGDSGDLDSLFDFFTMKGFTASRAPSSKEALELTARSRFDYIIVDLDLDGGNGLNLVQSMKLHPSAKSAQFIITARNVKKENVDQAVHLGVRGFFKSPFDFDKLSGMITGKPERPSPSN